MAILKFNRQQQINGVANVKIADNPNNKNQLMIGYIGFQGQIDNIIVDKNFKLRIEAEDCDLQQVEVNNHAIVIGNVLRADVENVLQVDGTVINFSNPRNSIKVNPEIKVVYGPEAEKRRELIYNVKAPKQQTKVLRLKGKMMKLSVTASSIEIETVILGKVEYIKAGNILEVKGNVQNAIVGNIIEATMGYSKAKSAKELQRREEQRRKESESFINNLFAEINK